MLKENQGHGLRKFAGKRTTEPGHSKKLKINTRWSLRKLRF
jgi:hypothetical protein